ncbi:hypothetical protein J6590_038042 [Homalodisca vitripennis]|nr:hypothetical protein J6590_038042 [Homalodisca vitripennis]
MVGKTRIGTLRLFPLIQYTDVFFPSSEFDNGTEIEFLPNDIDSPKLLNLPRCHNPRLPGHPSSRRVEYVIGETPYLPHASTCHPSSGTAPTPSIVV